MLVIRVIYYILGIKKQIKGIKCSPLTIIMVTYMTIKQKYKPSEKLVELLQEYADNCDFEKEITVGE